MMTGSYQIRGAETADLAFLQEIERAAATLFPPGCLPDPNDARPMEELETAKDNDLLLVAVWEEAIVGFAMSKEYESFLHLAEIAVHPDFGRRGIGTQLVLAVIQQAVRRHLSGVTLTTFQDIPWNAPFYAKVGFRILHRCELSSMLRGILTREESLGMKNRVAMLYSNVA